jgi:hypothetical protein
MKWGDVLRQEARGFQGQKKRKVARGQKPGKSRVLPSQDTRTWEKEVHSYQSVANCTNAWFSNSSHR